MYIIIITIYIYIYTYSYLHIPLTQTYRGLLVKLASHLRQTSRCIYVKLSLHLGKLRVASTSNSRCISPNSLCIYVKLSFNFPLHVRYNLGVTQTVFRRSNTLFVNGCSWTLCERMRVLFRLLVRDRFANGSWAFVRELGLLLIVLVLLLLLSLLHISLSLSLYLFSLSLSIYIYV